MADIQLTQPLIEKLVNLVNIKYPDWQGFSDPRYIEDELSYKESAVEAAQLWLKKDELIELLNNQQFSEFKERIEKVAYSGKNLLYLAVPTAGDLKVLYDESLDQKNFFQAFYNLLYGDSSSSERLEHFSKYLETHDLPNKWAFATYFMYLIDPKSDMFVKPTTKSWFLKFCGADRSLPSKPNGRDYQKILDLCNQLMDELRQFDPTSFIDIQSFLWVAKQAEAKSPITIEKMDEFETLYNEFLSNYLFTEKGEKHKHLILQGRREAVVNLTEVNKALKKDEDITDIVLLKLLPYSDSKNNREKGAWINIAPAIQGNIKTWFENAGWTKSEDWPKISKAILNFVNTCIDDPDSLKEACTTFTELPYTTGFQTGMLTPILNALNPDEFLLVNNKSRKVINYFTDSDYPQPLTNYPKINEVGKSLINVLDQIISKTENVDIENVDLFDIFSHWLVAEKLYFKPSKLGENIAELFGNVDEAILAFKFLEAAITSLHIDNKDDPRIALSFYKPGKDIKMHLSYGNWLALGFQGSEGRINQVLIGLLKDSLDLNFISKGDFVTTESEPKVTLYRLTFKEFEANQDRLLISFQETMEHFYKKFCHWKASPFRNSSKDEILETLFDESLRDKLLAKGTSLGPNQQEIKTRYWKIAPGREAWNWDTWKEENIITIGWDQVGDLSGKSKDEIVEVYDETMKEYPDWGPGGKTQLTRFMEIQIGDQIIANKGKSEILGYGTVVGDYYFIPGMEHGHRIPVQWDSFERKSINEGGWAMTILELSKDKFDQLLSIETKEGLFTQRTFDLLAGLHADPTAEFYSNNKEALKEYVEEPFQDLMRTVVDKLNPEILDFMETEKGVFSRFLKNDYGRGGAWDYYWGRFYPKGINKSDGPQLLLFINREAMYAGFMFGDYASDAKEHFLDHIKSNKTRIDELLGDIFSKGIITTGNRYLYDKSVNDGEPKPPSTIDAWMADSKIAEYDLTRLFLKEEVLHLSLEDLSDEIAEIYNQVYPFVILASSTNPIPMIERYLDISPPQIEQPYYSLEKCSEDTGFDLAELSKYVRAIERKKQAIFYGPPGTGKTYLAEKIAKHLVGDGTGFIELIQFHPEVAYEDFIQGIRPQENENGDLRYPLMPGRFREFCEKANQTKDICVLIIDEINRANLSRVFGELMYLLEYRDKAIHLAAGERFKIPLNVRIIGTMNTADRSIALVDHALRRRFAFLSLYPDYDLLRKYHERTASGFEPENLIKILNRLNKQIGDRHYFIGPSYFLRKDIHDHLQDIWQMEIEPYLEEFFFDQPDNYKKFAWETIETEIGQ
jgi:5-methylcytosine-specific restriction enzyme B